VGQPNRETRANAALEAAFAKLQLKDDLQRDLLRIQWLNSLLWMDHRASRSWTVYAALKLVAIVGAVFVPALVAVTPPPGWGSAVRASTFVLSLSVALATALESFFRSGERWRHYRRVAEALRLEGMQFLMLSGPYNKAATHQDALNEFSTTLNAILATEVDTYFTKVAVEKTSQDQSGDQSSSSERSASRA
jgi:hypothetical protein